MSIGITRRVAWSIGTMGGGGVIHSTGEKKASGKRLELTDNALAYVMSKKLAPYQTTCLDGHRVNIHFSASPGGLIPDKAERDLNPVVCTINLNCRGTTSSAVLYVAESGFSGIINTDMRTDLFLQLSKVLEDERIFGDNSLWESDEGRSPCNNFSIPRFGKEEFIQKFEPELIAFWEEEGRIGTVESAASKVLKKP